MEYKEFLENKRMKTQKTGFKISLADVNEKLFDWQKAVVLEAVENGKFCIFAECGLGKTFMQIEYLYHILKKEGGIGLIVAPLCVNLQTISFFSTLISGIAIIHTTGMPVDYSFNEYHQ